VVVLLQALLPRVLLRVARVGRAAVDVNQMPSTRPCPHFAA
jgi:hypothetical protein